MLLISTHNIFLWTSENLHSNKTGYSLEGAVLLLSTHVFVEKKKVLSGAQIFTIQSVIVLQSRLFLKQFIVNSININTT